MGLEGLDIVEVPLFVFEVTSVWTDSVHLSQMLFQDYLGFLHRLILTGGLVKHLLDVLPTVGVGEFNISSAPGLFHDEVNLNIYANINYALNEQTEKLIKSLESVLALVNELTRQSNEASIEDGFV